MQNAADFGGYIIYVKIAHAYFNLILLRAQISQNVKYWYEICDVLVPIFHAL